MYLNYQDSLIPKSSINTGIAELSSYLKYLQSIVNKLDYSKPEASLVLPFDSTHLQSVMEVSKEFLSDRLKFFINIGIGGSNLGAKAVYDALFGYFDLLDMDRYPKMIFLDTNNPRYLAKLLRLLQNTKLEEVLVNVISKSGSTTETIVNLELLLQAYPDLIKRLIVTTDESSKLDNLAREKSLPVLNLPKLVGGRYSVFSTVGLFPLHIVGIDIKNMLKGAQEAVIKSLKADHNNPALLSALALVYQYRQGKNIFDTFFFSPELESMGKWYRQLLGESLGKEKNLQDETVLVGPTPTITIGSVDLHSVGQLYFGGPRDKVTTFVTVANVDQNPKLSKKLQFSLVNNIEGKSAQTIMEAIATGTKATCRKGRYPFLEVILPDISAHSLGEFMQFKMLEMMLMGKLLNVNPFDQPHVELYKIETRKILEKT